MIIAVLQTSHLVLNCFFRTLFCGGRRLAGPWVVVLRRCLRLLAFRQRLLVARDVLSPLTYAFSLLTSSASARLLLELRHAWNEVYRIRCSL